MKKALKIVLSSLIVIIVTLAVVPYFFKKDIEKFIKNEINQNLNASLDYDQLDLSFFRDFPNLNVMVSNFRIDGKGDFKDVRLAHIDQFKMSLDAKRLLFKKDIEIKKIGLEGADFKIKVLKNGKANYDIVKTDTTHATKEEASSYAVKLKNYAIAHANLDYDDESMNMHLKIRNLNQTGEGIFTDKAYILKNKSQIDTLDVKYDGIHYLNQVRAKADAQVNIEDEFNKYHIKNAHLSLNELPLELDMMLTLKDDDTNMDIKYQTTGSQLKNLLSLVPKAYMPDFKGLKTNGVASIKGYVKGTYNDKNFPAFGTEFTIKQGYIKYPDLPQAVQNINVVGAVNFPGGKDLDLTTVSLPKINFAIAGNDAKGYLYLKHLMTDPEIKTAFRSAMDLSHIKQAVYLPQIKKLKGILKADINLDGHVSAIEKQAFEQFKAKGYFDLTGFDLAAKDMPYPVKINNAQVDITPQALKLNRFNSQIGQSDFDIKGEITNYISYFLKKDEVLKAQADLHSNYINMNEFMTADSQDTQNASQDSLIRIPKNIAVIFKADADKVRYKNLILNKLKGEVKVDKQKAELSSIWSKAFGGQLKIAGVYDTSKPDVETALKLVMDQVVINQTAEKLTLFKTYAPILKKISGQLFSDMQMKVALDNQMNPELQTLEAKGLFKTGNISVAGIDVVKKVSELLKIKGLDQATVDQIKAQFEIDHGNMQVKPFHFKINGIKSGLQGRVGLDQTIDFVWRLEVPRKMLGGKANQILGNLIGKVNFLGLKSNLGDIIPLRFKIKGNYKQPKIIPVIGNVQGDNAQDLVTQAVNQKIDESVAVAKEKATEAARQKAADILKQAEIEAEKLKTAAKKAGDKIRSEAQKQAEKLIKEAGNDPFKKLAAQALAKKIVQQADKKAQILETEAANKAALIMKNAEEKAKQLVP